MTPSPSEPVERSPAAGNDPAVSVIIPSFNTAGFIAETLVSVFAQTFTDYEVIVINDGSPDTQPLEEAIAPCLNRIVYIKQENRGPSNARNTGIRHARGRFIAFLDSDDMWLPEFLAESMALFQDNDRLDLVYSDAYAFGNLPLFKGLAMGVPRRDTPVTFESILTGKSQVVTSCTIVRKSAAIDAGLFDEQLRRVEDYDLWLRIAHLGGGLAHQPRTLGFHRIHGSSLSAASVKMLEDWLSILRKLPNVLSLSDQRRALVKDTIRIAQAELALTRGNEYLRAGQTELARASFEEAYEVFGARKLRVLVLGLRIVPWLTPSVVKIWRWLLSVVELLRAAKNGRLRWVQNRQHPRHAHL